MHRWFAAAIVAAATLALLPGTAVADNGADEAAFVAKINDLRLSKGLHSLTVDPVLVAKARGWAQTMANKGDIWHSNLPDGVTENWQRLGENVGMGGSVNALHDAFVGSPHHYENLIDPGFRYVGVGVVNANGTIFVSEVFMELASQPAPTTSAPAAGTPSSAAGGADAKRIRPRPVPAPFAAPVAAPVAASAPPIPAAPPAPPAPSAQLLTVLERLRSLAA
jgi:hypothetical protein